MEVSYQQLSQRCVQLWRRSSSYACWSPLAGRSAHLPPRVRCAQTSCSVCRRRTRASPPSRTNCSACGSRRRPAAGSERACRPLDRSSVDRRPRSARWRAAPSRTAGRHTARRERRARLMSRGRAVYRRRAGRPTSSDDSCWCSSSPWFPSDTRHAVTQWFRLVTVGDVIKVYCSYCIQNSQKCVVPYTFFPASVSMVLKTLIKQH